MRKLITLLALLLLSTTVALAQEVPPAPTDDNATVLLAIVACVGFLAITVVVGIDKFATRNFIREIVSVTPTQVDDRVWAIVEKLLGLQDVVAEVTLEAEEEPATTTTTTTTTETTTDSVS